LLLVSLQLNKKIITMNSSALTITRPRLVTILLDLGALAFIYFVPAISHLLAFPLYLIEPMRIMLIIAIAHTSKKNAYLLALTLPVFSFAVSGHPAFLKSLLISLELAVNVWLFFTLSGYIKNKFATMALAIVASKLFYYLLKFGLLSLALMTGTLVSIPIHIQVIVTLVLCTYIYLVMRKPHG